MVARLRTWYFVTTQLSAWLWCRLHFVQCGTYNTYEIYITANGELHTCYDAIIDAGVRRLQPIQVVQNTASVIVQISRHLMDFSSDVSNIPNCALKISQPLKLGDQVIFRTSLDYGKQLVQADTNQEYPESEKIVIITYKQDKRDECIKCSKLDGHEKHSASLSTIFKVSKSIVEISSIHSECVQIPEKSCTLVMLRPASEQKNFIEPLKNTQVLTTQAAQVVRAQYDGSIECAKCIFKYCEVFYSDAKTNCLWVNVLRPKNFDCNDACGDRFPLLSEPEYNYLPPKPLKFELHSVE